MVLKHWVDTNCKINEYDIATIIKNCVPIVLTTSKKIKMTK